MPRAGDLFGHLVPGQLAALSGLGALRHLNLQLVRVRQVAARHTEPARCHLEKKIGKRVKDIHMILCPAFLAGILARKSM